VSAAIVVSTGLWDSSGVGAAGVSPLAVDFGTAGGVSTRSGSRGGFRGGGSTANAGGVVLFWSPALDSAGFCAGLRTGGEPAGVVSDLGLLVPDTLFSVPAFPVLAFSVLAFSETLFSTVLVAGTAPGGVSTVSPPKLP
jgi:hypothetical protein